MNAKEIGQLIRATRKQLKLTQSELALTAGTATRFISDLENGKPTCQLERTLSVLRTLGLKITITPNSTELRHG
jgi:y4mF family transcriptional regulator